MAALKRRTDERFGDCAETITYENKQQRDITILSRICEWKSTVKIITISITGEKSELRFLR